MLQYLCPNCKSSHDAFRSCIGICCTRSSKECCREVCIDFHRIKTVKWRFSIKWACKQSQNFARRTYFEARKLRWKSVRHFKTQILAFIFIHDRLRGLLVARAERDPQKFESTWTSWIHFRSSKHMADLTTQNRLHIIMPKLLPKIKFTL